MANRSYVSDEAGRITHIRETDEGLGRSYLYEVDTSLSGLIFNDCRGRCVEVAEHHPDGSTDAYEPDLSVVGTFLDDQKGRHK